MTYMTQSVISTDQYMRHRVSSCAAGEGCATEAGINPDSWTLEWSRVWSTGEGWDAKWEEALARENPPDYSVGSDPDVITDQMILDQIKSMEPFRTIDSHKPTVDPFAVQEYVFDIMKPMKDQMDKTQRMVNDVNTRLADGL